MMYATKTFEILNYCKRVWIVCENMLLTKLQEQDAFCTDSGHITGT
jgi:hypothetical protein